MDMRKSEFTREKIVGLLKRVDPDSGVTQGPETGARNTRLIG
jgi:hypothetical protein